MNPSCAACAKPVYPVEKLVCLDQNWHKACFRCQTCKMVLNMKNHKGFQKKPYCEAHYPKLSATQVADTPEMNRLKENSKIQSQAKYHAEYENLKGQYTAVAETPEMNLHKQNSLLSSQAHYDQRDHSIPADAGGYNPPPSMLRAPAAAAAPAHSYSNSSSSYSAQSYAPPAAAAPAYQEGRYKALFSYDASDDDEVSFVEGDYIINGAIVADGWMQGTVQRTGATGLLPSNYVEAA